MTAPAPNSRLKAVQTAIQANPPPGIRTQRRVVDWDAIEPHFRAGIRTIQDIADEFGVSHVAILKHASKNQWTRNQAGKVKARADAMVTAALVTAEVTKAKSVTKKAAQKQVIEVEATVQARIRLAHREAIGRARALTEQLLAEVELQTLRKEDLAKLVEVLDRAINGPSKPAGKASGKAQAFDAKATAAALQKVLQVGERAGTLRTLVESIAKLVALEREAYSIGKDEELADPFSEFLRGLRARPLVPAAGDPDLFEPAQDAQVKP